MLEQAIFKESLKLIPPSKALKKQRSGTFIDNMKLPVHRWFRYSAGFSAEWVKQILLLEKPQSILDPFSGSGTVNIVADELRIKSFGYEAHPFVFRLSKCKTYWSCDVEEFLSESKIFLSKSRSNIFEKKLLNDNLLSKCYIPEILTQLLRMKSTWLELYSYKNNRIGELLFLALTSILRTTSSAGTAQWQYILPDKKKVKIVTPEQAFLAQVSLMADDMRYMQKQGSHSLASIYNADSRSYNTISENFIDLVITSPPYANNYDYADATRLEMTFWGKVSCWGDLHNAVRKYLICSSAQHASKEKFDLNQLLKSPHLKSIVSEISPICSQLAEVRETKGGKKHYHTMVAAYFNDMSQIFKKLRKVVTPNAKMFFVIGDSAPYGVYVPVEKWLGNLAVSAGFKEWSFKKIRDRNVKWENRKHKVPLKEGILLIK